MKDFKYLRIEIQNQAALILFNRNQDNSMNVEMMNEIGSAHQLLNENEMVNAIILTSDTPGFFSNGLDIYELLESDTNGKIRMFEALYNMCQSVYSFKKIHACLVNGHAMAGGAILAVMSDFRFMSNGPYRISFSEVKLGLAVPSLFIQIIQSVIGQTNLNKAILQGKAYKPPDAFTAGLLDDIFAENEALLKTQKFVNTLLQNPLQSYVADKLYLRKNLVNQFDLVKTETLENFSVFFNDNFTNALLSLAQKSKRWKEK